MIARLNATVRSGYVNRDGDIVHWIQLDSGQTVQVKHSEALPDGKRVRLVNGRIEKVQ